LWNWQPSDQSIQRHLKHAASQGGLEDFLEVLSSSLEDTTPLLEQMQSELDALVRRVENLKEEAAVAAALARRNRVKAETGGRRLDEKLERTERRIHSDSVKIAILSFVATTVVALLIALLVH
jgi:uncharacterized coiled-coil protein SlyX